MSVRKYYLMDAKFMLKGQIIIIYQGVKCHLKKYSYRGQQTLQELFSFNT